MKTLIILAGLPGTGKSYACRILKKKLPRAHYFDSDLFAKKYSDKRGINIMALPKKEQELARLTFHREKIVKLRKLFEKYDIIYIDTCFDLLESRRVFYRFTRDKSLQLVIIEMLCPSEVVKKRIFENRHETERMVGDKDSRWKIHKQMKASWRPIRKKHYVIKSDKDVENQLKDIFKVLQE